MIYRCFVLCLVALPLLLVNVATAEGTLKGFKTGDLMPPITLPTVDSGRQQSFTPGSGKPAAVLFFSIVPEFRKKRSLALLAALNDLAGQLRNRAAILAVFSDDQEKDVVQGYIRQSGIRIPVLDDPDKRTYAEYGIFMMPLVVILDQQGRLHDVLPYTFNVRDLAEGNLRVLLGDWKPEQLQRLLEPAQQPTLSKEDKEYIRRLNYGKVMAKRRMFDKAVREFNVAIQLKPDGVEAHTELGFALLALRRYAEAEKAFTQALAVDSESDDGIAGLGLALYGQGKTDAALKELENALIAPDPRLEVIITLADIHEKKGNVKRAMRLNKLAVARLLQMYQHRWQEQK